MKQKLFTILTLLLCLCSTAWADTVLFSTNFSTTDGWTNGDIITSSTTSATKTINGTTISFAGYKNSALKISNATADGGTLTFTGNNLSANEGPVAGSNPNYYMAIPVTGVVGGMVTVTITTSSSFRPYYSYDDGSEGSIVDRTQATANNTFTITGLTKNKVTIYLGTSGKTMTSLTITTPETVNVTSSNFYNFYKQVSSDPGATSLISGASLPSYISINNCTSTDNGSNNTSSIENPHDFTELGTSKYYRLKPGTNSSIVIGGVSNVKSIRLYGNGSGGGGSIKTTVTKVSGTGTAMTVADQEFANAKTSILEFSTGDLTALAGYDANTYYLYTITFTASFSLWGIYVEVPSGPTLSVDPTTANTFTYVVDNGPSAAQTFTVTGSNLTSTITATLSNTTNYEMKTGDGEYGAGPLTDLASGTAVQVRLKSGLALGDSYSGNLTFSSTGADDKAIALSGSVTNQKYSITEGTHTNGDITIDKETAEEGDEVTLTATPDFKYVFGSWNVYKTGEPATTVTVTNNQFTMPAYAVTVDATFTADPKKQVLYLTSNGTVNDNDKLYAALAEDYTVTKAAFDATKTVTDFDLVVFHESIGGGNYNKNLVKAAIEADVPVLNTKSYFYGADQNANDRWKWGAPNAGTSVAGATLNPAYGNIASHPIFDGVDISDAGFVTLFNAATAKAMQPVTALASGKEGYTLAITPNVAAVGGNGVAIHELSATQRGLTSGSAKYLMVSIGDGYGCFEKLTTNGQKLLKNAAAYLIDNTASWTPTTSVSGTITASGWNTFSSYAALDLSKINGGAAYVASATSGNSVTLTPVTDKIVAAGTGLMIKGTAGDDFTIDVATANANFSGTNLLVGLPNGGEVAKANNTDTWNYVFGWTDPTDPGFYLVNATLPTLGAGKAYLQTNAALTANPGARLNIVFEGETTGISNVDVNANDNFDANAPMYNLAGQRVNKSYKGVVIVNGKKYMNK